MEDPYIDRLINGFERRLGQEKLKWVLDQFHGEKSTEEMFTFLWDLEDAHNSLSPTLMSSGKSNSQSEKFREEGEYHLHQENFDKALELLNCSLMAAEHPALSDHLPYDKINNNDSSASFKESTVLANVYACRSAVLFELEQYEESLRDMEQALMYGFPEPELKQRQDKCLSMLMREPVISNDTDDVDFDDVYSMIDKLRKVPEESWTSKEILQSSKKKRQLPKLIEHHPNVPALSSALRLKYTPTKGRHIIADRDIMPGEVVALERSYCNGLYYQDSSNHCNTCLMECLAPLPCPNCSMVIFCSEDCRAMGLSATHWQECSILPTLAILEKRENIVTYLALKLILQTPFTTLRDKISVLESEEKEYDPIRLGFNSKGVYSSTEYRPLYHLVHNKSKRSNRELYETCITAFVLTKVIIMSKRYFRDSNEQPIEVSREDLILLGRLLFHHIMNIYCNAFQLSDMKLTAPPIKTVLNVFGEGIFPGLSLFNHSCNPNVRHYNYRDHLVLRAVRFIPAGEEVCTTYCGAFYLENFETRRQYLAESYIDCTCEACLGRWPMNADLPFVLKIKCTSCSMPLSDSGHFTFCPSCHLNYGETHRDENTQILVDKWWSISEHLKNSESKMQHILMRKKLGQPVLRKDIDIISQYLQCAGKHLKLPNLGFCYGMDTMFLIFCLEFCSGGSDK
ncbi:SET and MYND domain-containing protein 4-like [Macrobrachium nipponense]|uniref:SET and MYND domain-containing protein 4-like n=1 Tax=Macrobrachium nipponense TaxID=159736 RepID=UPI0030C8AD1B